MRRGHPARDWSRILIALAVAGLVPAPAFAAGGANCGLFATPLAFTATITVTCSASGTTPVPISGTINLTGAGGPAGRHLTDGAHQLRYQLYRDPARSASWGDGGGVGAVSISGVVGPTTPFRQALTVYGRILARQSDAGVGKYVDHFTVVLNY
jgi:spore coat protein U-like protein